MAYRSRPLLRRPLSFLCLDPDVLAGEPIGSEPRENVSQIWPRFTLSQLLAPQAAFTEPSAACAAMGRKIAIAASACIEDTIFGMSFPRWTRLVKQCYLLDANAAFLGL